MGEGEGEEEEEEEEEAGEEEGEERRIPTEAAHEHIDLHMYHAYK